MSFSFDTKLGLCTIPVKPLCCKKAILYGLLYSQSDMQSHNIRFSTDQEKIAQLFSSLMHSLFHSDAIFEETQKLTRRRSPIIGYRYRPPDGKELSRITDSFAFDEPLPSEGLFVCENCRKHFLRGLFLSAGTIVSPESGYHMEFSVSDPVRCQALCNFLSEQGIPAKLTKRRGVTALYIKESEVIEDFLTLIGAPQAALSIMEMKIMRDIRNNENRRNNCDTANIYKSTGAAIQQVHSIRKLSDSGRLSSLPKPLQETATLRLENPEISMSELAALHDPPITKSGVSHRLAKIMEICEKEDQ